MLILGINFFFQGMAPDDRIYLFRGFGFHTIYKYENRGFVNGPGGFPIWTPPEYRVFRHYTIRYKGEDGESHEFVYASGDSFESKVVDHTLERMTPYLTALWTRTMPELEGGEGMQEGTFGDTVMEIPGLEISHEVAPVAHEGDRFRRDLTSPSKGIQFKGFQPADMGRYDIALEIRVRYTPAESSLDLTSQELMDLLTPAVEQLQADTGLRDRLIFWIVMLDEEDNDRSEWHTALYNAETGGMDWTEGRHVPKKDMGVYLFGMEPF